MSLTSRRELVNQQKVWEDLARADPLWAILSQPAKKGNRWDLEEFFDEGQREIEQLMRTLRQFGLPVRTGAALDFGCGVGRLTQFLAEHYDSVVGVDISPTMLELAARFNWHGEQVHYALNTVDDLHIFQDAQFDLIYSNLVLQHVDPESAVRYLGEFFRCTHRDGFIVFQIPSHYSDDYLPRESVDEPLPADACRAVLTLRSAPPTLSAASSGNVAVEVTNGARRDWAQSLEFPLQVGNHWLSDDASTVVVQDDGRTRLPGRMPAGSARVLEVEVTAPQAAGTYWLEFDIVQEGVRWFRDVGSATLRVPVRVVPRPEASTQPDFPVGSNNIAVPAAPESFTMSGVPKDEVVRLISDFGSTLLRAEEHVSEWYSYKYYVRRTY